MTTDFAARRLKMVDGQLRTTDVNDANIVSAMMSVPREQFVPAARVELAYIDEDIEVAPGRYLMEPSPFGKLLQAAAITKSDKVLDVGCNTGYSAAVLAHMAASVTALEADEALSATARENLSRLHLDNASVITGSLAAGHASGAPYDVILVNGAVDEVPPALLDQLADNGRLVAVVGHRLSGTARVYLKSGGVATGRVAFNAAVRPLPGFERKPEFQF